MCVSRRLHRAAFCGVLALLLAVPAAAQVHAQSAAPSLAGQVIDASKGTVPGVTVTLLRPEGSAVKTVLTGPDGRYSFEDVAAGLYEVRAELFGFRPAVASNIQVDPGSTRRVDLQLSAAGLAETVTVTAARAPTPIAAIPASVTVLDQEAVAVQATLSRNLQTILAKTLPGLGMSREAESNFGQNLRGRGMLMLLDGVPQNFELRQGALDEMNRIDPSRIERIEVVRGASAVYGSEAAGGIINIITKGAPATGLSFTTEVGTTLATTHPGDSGTYRLFQGVGGRAGAVDYFAAGGATTADGVYDAAGDRVPEIFPVGTSYGTTADVGGRAALRLTPQRRLAASAHFYWARKDEGYGSADGIVGVQKARAVSLPPGIGSPADLGFTAERPFKNQGTYTLTFDDASIGASALTVQLLQMHYERLNDYFATGGGQLNPKFRKSGARLSVQTPLSFLSNASVTWGADYVFYRHAEPTNTGLTWTPPLDQHSLAGFAQASVQVGTRVTLRGGLRYEDFTVNVDDFTQNPAFGSRQVRGGALDYDASIVNLGGVVSLTDGVQAFAGFSQGFSITQVGRLLVNTTLPSVSEARPEPSKVDAFEAGVRGAWAKAQFTAAGFYSRSKLGTSLIVVGTAPPEVIRAPERTYGWEGTVDVQPLPRWRTGGTVAWQEGEEDPDFDTVYTPMTGLRITPIKITGYGEHQTTDRWRSRLQVVYSGERDEFPGSTMFGQGAMTRVTLVDLVSTYRLGGATISFGIENLTNRFYYPQANQAFNQGFNYLAGRGRTMSLNLALPWSR